MGEPDSQLRKSFTLFGLTMIAVSASFGSGIFFSVSQSAEHVPDKNWIMYVWIAGGIISLTGALTFAELGSKFPGTGGVYVYLRRAYGEPVAFLYGWSSLTIITSGAIAALALAFVNNLDFFFGFSDSGKMALGTCTILVLTVINIVSAKLSEQVASVGTILKIIGVVVIVVAGLFFAGEPTWPLAPGEDIGTAFGTLDVGLAMVGAMWAYGGWHYAATLAGETRNATVIVPRAMVLGSTIITLIYIAVNLSYLECMHPLELAKSKSPAAEIIAHVSSHGAALMAGLIALSVFITASIYTATAPRIYFQMARDGLFFPWLAHVDKTFRVPLRAICIQSAWAIVLMIGWKKFSNAITYVTITDWVFLLLAGLAVFIFRRENKTELQTILDSPLPATKPANTFKVPIYPYTTIVFVVMVFLFIAAVMLEEPNSAVAFAYVIASGLVAHLLFRKWLAARSL